MPAIWDYARSQTDIQNDLNNSLFGNEPGLVAYYPMSDGTGSTTITDATGGINTGSLINMDENADWMAGPVLSPPNPGVPTFFKDFTDESLPVTASSGPFLLDGGNWNGDWGQLYKYIYLVSKHVEISTSTDFTLNGAMATILAIDFDNMGTFRTEVTSSLVPGLTIDADPQAVLAIADMQVSVTDANGDPLTAPLNGSMLETTPIATGFGVLETVENVSTSTFTFPDVVLGDYIIFIESDLDLYIPAYFGNVFE